MPGESSQRHAGSDTGTIVECRVLGGFDLVGGPAPEALHEVCNRPKLVGLLIYLLLAGREAAVSRDVLLAMFWPDSSQFRARQSLRQSLYLLRRACGQDAIVARSTRVRINRARFRVDLYRLLGASAAGDHQVAVQLYAGSIAPGVYLSGCPEFDHWLEDERSRLHDLALTAAREWARAERESGNLVGALLPLRRALTFAPYDEELIADLVTTLFQSGDRAGAVCELQAFVTRFRTEMELDPGAETLGLLDRLAADPPKTRPRRPVIADPAPGLRDEGEEPGPEAGAPDPPRDAGRGAGERADPVGQGRCCSRRGGPGGPSVLLAPAERHEPLSERVAATGRGRPFRQPVR